MLLKTLQPSLRTLDKSVEGASILGILQEGAVALVVVCFKVQERHARRLSPERRGLLARLNCSALVLSRPFLHSHGCPNSFREFLDEKTKRNAHRVANSKCGSSPRRVTSRRTKHIQSYICKARFRHDRCLKAGFDSKTKVETAEQLTGAVAPLHTTRYTHRGSLPGGRSKPGSRMTARDKLFKMAKGFRGRSKNCYRIAKQSVEKALQYAYRDRKQKKRDMRSLWIQRVNAGSKEHGVRHSACGRSRLRSRFCSAEARDAAQQAA